MNKTTLILAAAVFGGVLGAAAVLTPVQWRSAPRPRPAPRPQGPLTPAEQAEMAELNADTTGMGPREKDRIDERRDLVRDYPLSVIDAAEADGKLPRGQYRVAVATPAPEYRSMEPDGAQYACTAWQNEEGDVIYEIYTFTKTYIGHSGMAPLTVWVRNGCAAAMAADSQVVNEHGLLQALYYRIPPDNAYLDSRAGVMARMQAVGTDRDFTPGVQYFH